MAAEAERRFRLGQVWLQRGQAAQALDHYRAAMSLHPERQIYALKLAELLTEQGHLAEAMSTCQAGLAIESPETPMQRKLHALLGWLIGQTTPTGADAPAASRSSGEAPPLNGVAAVRPASPTVRPKARHLLVYTDSDGFMGGVAQCNHLLISALVEAGHRVTCARPRHPEPISLPGDSIWLKPDNLYDLSQPGHTLTDPTEAGAVFDEVGPDLIVFADGAPMSNLKAKEVARKRNIPYIVIVHCVAATWARQYSQYLPDIAAGYAGAEAVVAVSQANLLLLQEHFGLPREKGQVILNGRPDLFFQPQQPDVRQRMRASLGALSNEQVVCLTVGRLEGVKGYHYLLDAIWRLRARPVWPQLIFWWCGVGTLEPQIREHIEKMGATEQVRLLGARTDVAALLDAADLFILPSQFEGMPLAVVEAMAKGVPVIATSVSGTPEALGAAGHLLPDPALSRADLVQALVGAIEALATDAPRRQALGAAGHERAKQCFTVPTMTSQYLSLLDAVLLHSG